MLAAINYAPLLRTKPAEINAYHTLRGSEKSVTFPVFLTKPWQNANHFQKTLDKVVGAVDGRPFGFGLDRDFLAGDAKQPAQSEFDRLFNPDLGYRHYFDCVQSLHGAVPVFIGGGSADQLLMQLGNADELGRGLVVRFTRGEITPILSLAGTIPPLPNDTVFIVDAGWGRDALQLSQWADASIRRILSAIPDAEIVVMSSTFPDSFNAIVGHGLVNLHESDIFRTLRASHNEAKLTYGDWATTRPPQSGGGGTIPPRIDVPSFGTCNVFRADTGADETYLDMVKLAMAHPCFRSVPNCFGRELIETTRDGAGITGTQRATEARINIHMTMHAMSPEASVHEEAYVD